MVKLSALVVVCCVLSGVCLGAGIPEEAYDTEWTYDERYAPQKNLLPPNKWGDKWESCKVDGDKTVQSPIDIPFDDVVVEDAGIFPLQFTSGKSFVNVRNIGATISAVPVAQNSYFVTASGKKYILHEAHVHWNHFLSESGTEHRLNGIGDAAEVHLVHYDSKFNSMDAALQSDEVGSIAVIAVFYRLAGGSDTSAVPAFDIFAEQGIKLRYMDFTQSVGISSFKLYDLFGATPKMKAMPMFHYNGSLTTPPCTPTVSWFIAQEVVSLSNVQMKMLRLGNHLNETDTKANPNITRVPDNIRPLAPLNGRKIIAWPDVPSVASSISVQLFIYICSIILFIQYFF